MSEQTPEHIIELVAGRHPNGDLVMEKILVTPQQEKGQFLLLKSPVFVKGIARGDLIEQMDEPKGAFKIVQHGGNLSIRVYGKEDLSAIEQALTIELEKLGGTLDICQGNVLVYSVHVSCGFNAVEALLNQHLSDKDTMAWYYGNVYDPETGEPLNWWQAILSEN